eukprot:4742474-Pyramimonas_sp.AAC.1
MYPFPLPAGNVSATKRRYVCASSGATYLRAKWRHARQARSAKIEQEYPSGQPPSGRPIRASASGCAMRLASLPLRGRICRNLPEFTDTCRNSQECASIDSLSSLSVRVVAQQSALLVGAFSDIYVSNLPLHREFPPPLPVTPHSPHSPFRLSIRVSKLLYEVELQDSPLENSADAVEHRRGEEPGGASDRLDGLVNVDVKAVASGGTGVGLVYIEVHAAGHCIRRRFKCGLCLNKCPVHHPPQPQYEWKKQRGAAATLTKRPRPPPH